MLRKPPSSKAVQKPVLKKGLLTQLENIYHLTIKELRRWSQPVDATLGANLQ